MKVTVIESGSKYGVLLSQGNQFFRLDYVGTKSQARWFADMFEIALKNSRDEFLKEHFGIDGPLFKS
jgi:hypothetical protein